MDYIRENWLTLVIVLALGIGLGFLVSGSSSEPEGAESTTPASDADAKTPQADAEDEVVTTDESEETTETETEPIKETTQPQTVTEQPVVFTGFGNTAERPLGLEQTTSTTCTTDVGVECVLSFRNEETGQVIEFEATTTDSAGVARWVWQGSDLGAGSWVVTGTAGDTSSAQATVYVE